MRANAIAGALAVAWLASACADDASDSRLCGNAPCPERCEQLGGESCDVLQPSCRERILQAVACVRGMPGELPEVRTLTLDEYRIELEQDEREQDAGGAGDEDAGAAGPGGDEPWQAALELLGLMSSEIDAETAAIDDALENVGGYYDVQRRRITLINRGMPEDSERSQRLLAHELVHALQDQEFGLAELGERTGHARDASLASGCLVEGEADLYEDLAWSLLQDLPVDRGYWDVTLDRELKYARRSVITAPSPYSSVWILRYPIGRRYLADAWLDGGSSAVRSLYRGPPNSSIYFMHGYAGAAAGELLVLPLACDTAAAPEGFESYSDASLGALVVFAFLGRSLRDDGVYRTEEAWRDALHWRQDNLAVFTSEAGAVAASWRMRFDDEALAERVAGEIANLPGLGLEVRRAHDEIEVLASDDPAVLEAWTGTDPDACPAPP